MAARAVARTTPAGGFGQAERPGFLLGRVAAAALGTAGSPVQGYVRLTGRGVSPAFLRFTAPCRPGDPPPLAPAADP